MDKAEKKLGLVIEKRLIAEKKHYIKMINAHSKRARERLNDIPNTNTNHLADHATTIDIVVAHHIPTIIKVILAIDDALARLKAGTYGRCIDCGESIPLGRLNAVPWTKKCTACKQAEEEQKTVNYAGVPTRIDRREVVTY